MPLTLGKLEREPQNHYQVWGVGGGEAKQWFISDRHQPEGLLSKGVCKAAGAMVMPREAWTTGTPGAKC